MRAAAVGARLRGADRAADQHQVFQVEPVHPGQVVALLGIGHAHGGNRGGEVVQLVTGAGKALRGAQDADVVPHHLIEPPPHAFEIAAAPAERRIGALMRRLDRGLVGIGERFIGAQRRRHAVAGQPAEHRRVGDAVAAEPVGAVHAAGVLARPRRAAASRWCNRR